MRCVLLCASLWGVIHTRITGTLHLPEFIVPEFICPAPDCPLKPIAGLGWPPAGSSRLQKGHFGIEKCCHRPFNRSRSRVQAGDTVFCKWSQCGLQVMPAYNELIKPKVVMEKRR